MCPSKHPTLGEQGGPRPPNPGPQEPQAWVGRGQGLWGGQGSDAGGGQSTTPLGGLGGVLAANQGQPGTTWDMLRWGRHTAPSQVAQLVGWGRCTGPRTREEAAGGQATRSRDPGEARGGDLKPSVHGGVAWPGGAPGWARLCGANGLEVGGEAGTPRAWAGQDCAVGIGPSQPLVALGWALCSVPAPAPLLPTRPPPPPASPTRAPTVTAAALDPESVLCTGGRGGGAPARAQTPPGLGQSALSVQTSAHRPRPRWGMHTISWATSSGFCRSDF